MAVRLTVFVALIVITAGWWVAELGRQPWIVYEPDAHRGRRLAGRGRRGIVASPWAASSCLYAVLLVLFVYLLNKKIQHGPEPLEDLETVALIAA